MPLGENYFWCPISLKWNNIFWKKGKKNKGRGGGRRIRSQSAQTHVMLKIEYNRPFSSGIGQNMVPFSEMFFKLKGLALKSLFFWEGALPTIPVPP